MNMVILSNFTEFYFLSFFSAEKCRTLGSDLCFKLKIKEIVVKIGAVGTDDDVTLQICSDYDTSQVCNFFHLIIIFMITSL